METIYTSSYNQPRVEHKPNLPEFYTFPRLFATCSTTNPKQNPSQLLLVRNNSHGHLESRGQELQPFVLQPSLFHAKNVPPTIYFKTKRLPDSKPPVGLPKSLKRYFRWKLSTITPNSIKNCIQFMQFETIKPSDTVDCIFIGSWFKHMLTKEFANLPVWRKVNHYPGSFHLGRKDRLWARLKMAIQKFGENDFGIFHPQTFVLPRDYQALAEYWDRSSSKLFIIKPPASARGNGIQVINSIKQILHEHTVIQENSSKNKSTLVVQQYLSNPCLLQNGHKFDLRIYVLLTSIDPLRIYVYEDGLVRFASSKYDHSDDVNLNHFMHLTNYFVNKKNLDYKVNNDSDSLLGSKWTLKRFWSYLAEFYSDRVNTEQLWEQIKDIIIKTIVSCESPIYRFSKLHCNNDYTAYELFGFDIILDENFKPWILEVNITPSLKSESELDSNVKYSVIQDMFNIVGYNLPPIKPSELGNLNGYRLFDNRLYEEKLMKQDRMKQKEYVGIATQLKEMNGYQSDESQSDKLQRNISSISLINNSEIWRSDSENDLDLNFDTILTDLTQNDIRVLMISEDELSRKGQFTRVFPSSNSGKYLKYFEKQRYYNLLLDAWEQCYENNRIQGINRLLESASFLELPPMPGHVTLAHKNYNNCGKAPTPIATIANNSNSNSIDSSSETSNIPSCPGSESSTSSPGEPACD